MRNKGENRTSEEETELQQAISLRIMELAAVETLGDSENEELVGLQAELRRMKEVNDELIATLTNTSGSGQETIPNLGSRALMFVCQI